MKNFVTFLLAAFMLMAATVKPAIADAQIVKQLTIAAADDTLINADTAIVSLSIDATAKSVEGYASRVSGTAAGTIVLQGKTLHGSNWDDVESYIITNTATQYKIFAIPSTRVHAGYRLRFITTGTTVVVPKVYTLRYTGD